MSSDSLAVSVVIATRSRQAMLSEAIATVFDQSFADWELIVVDDASEDDTQAYLASLDDARVRVFRQNAHAERCSARNRGLAAARGEFIMFLDDDDLLRRSALTNLTAALRSHPAAVAAIAPCRILETDGNSTKVYWPSRHHERLIWRELLFGWWANSGQNLYRTSVIRELGGFDASFVACEDRKLWLNVARRGLVCLAPSVAMEYRLHAGQRKPANIDDIRRRVWSEFIAALPPRERIRAHRTRRAAELNGQSELARHSQHFGRALRLQVSACLIAPWLAVSPLTGRPMWWALKKCFTRSGAP